MIIKDSQTIHFAFINLDIILKRTDIYYYTMYIDETFHSLISVNDLHAILPYLKQLNEIYGSKLHKPYTFNNF